MGRDVGGLPKGWRTGPPNFDSATRLVAPVLPAVPAVTPDAARCRKSMSPVGLPRDERVEFPETARSTRPLRM
jgi:hypothetical protein